MRMQGERERKRERINRWHMEGEQALKRDGRVQGGAGGAKRIIADTKDDRKKSQKEILGVI